MKTLRYNSYHESVHFLEELLTNLGYDLVVSNHFGRDTDGAVRDFQKKNNLVVDGIVGMKTWSKLLAIQSTFTDQNSKFLTEADIVKFAQQHQLEVAVVKAVNEVESRGKGFLTDGRAVILFEGHIFWRQLKQRGASPESLSTTQNADILYSKWTRKHYKGGSGEYERLDRARQLTGNSVSNDAAYASASWGLFQIMGFHYKSLGYGTVENFVKTMQSHEREHLKAFGKFLEVNNLISKLKTKNWAAFAKAYNGPAYKQNKYDTKLEKAYQRYA